MNRNAWLRMPAIWKHRNGTGPLLGRLVSVFVRFWMANLLVLFMVAQKRDRNIPMDGLQL